MKKSRMKKFLFLTVLSASVLLLSSCSTPVPEPAPEPSALLSQNGTEPGLVEMQRQVDETVRAGGLAALGTAESRSLDLALNMARRNGRIALAQRLNERVEAMAKTFSEESGIAYDSLLRGFSETIRLLTLQISASTAQTLKYETKDGTFAAYAVMVLDPEEIRKQLSTETDLYAQLQSSKALDALLQQIASYQAFTGRTAPSMK